MNKITTAVLISFALLFSIQNSLAADKKYSLDIAVPNNVGAPAAGSPFVGGRMFINEDTAIEVSGSTIQLLGKDTNAGTLGGTQIVASGGIMQYISKGRVSPYLHAGGTISLFFGDRFTGTDNAIQGYAGIGAEFMFTDELSLRTSVNAVLGISPFVLTTNTTDLTLSFLF